MVRHVLKRPAARIGAGLAVVVVGIVAAGAFYLFGPPFGSASPSGDTAHGSGAAPTQAPTLAPTKNGTIFTIDSSSSQATFTISEVLFGQPNTVVGKTNAVTGQILVDRQDPSQSQIGQIRVDLSTLLTDSDFRNQTLRHRILETDTAANQFATFVARSVTGLPSSISVGQTISFHITGDLTIHQVTRSVTFDAQVTPVSTTTLTGQAQATVQYADFGVAIPDVPSVTSVGETVKLALTFTARA